LPMLYYERYGRTLQAEGYLAESQRHGKAGYNLAKLLARLNNSICLIDRCTSISSFHFVYFPLSFNFTGQFQLDIYGFFYVTGLMGSIQWSCLKMLQNTSKIKQKKWELSQNLAKSISLFRLKVRSQSKMFLTTLGERNSMITYFTRAINYF